MCIREPHDHGVCALVYINPLLRPAALTCKTTPGAICLYAWSLKYWSPCRGCVGPLCPFNKRIEHVISPCEVSTSHMSSKLLSAAHHLLDDDSNSEGVHAIARDDSCHAWLRDIPVKALHPDRQEQPFLISINLQVERYLCLPMPIGMFEENSCAGNSFAWGHPAR